MWPSVSDFWLTLVMTPVFLILERVFQWALYPWYWQHCKEKDDLEVRDVRTRKAVNNIYKCIYYSLSTFFGWYTLKDSYILPPALGGKGSLENLFTDFPYIKHPPLYKYYFTGTMGYHIGSLLHHALAHQKSNDYLEMMFHHLVTFYLYSFSYMSNTLIGAVMVSFIITLVFWFYSRLLMLPWCIYMATVKLEVYVLSPYVQPIFGFLLTCLFYLHIYWFILCVKIVLNFFENGEAEDLQNKSGKKKQYQKEIQEEDEGEELD